MQDKGAGWKNDESKNKKLFFVFNRKVEQPSVVKMHLKSKILVSSQKMFTKAKFN